MVPLIVERNRFRWNGAFARVVFKRLQHRGKLIQRGWHLKTEFIQPYFVDKQKIAQIANVIHIIAVGQANTHAIHAFVRQRMLF